MDIVPAEAVTFYTYKLEFPVYVIIPGTLSRPPKPDMNAVVRYACSDIYRESCVIRAGRVDGENPDHFSIECDVNGVTNWIDGWLNEDGTVLTEWRVGSKADRGKGVSRELRTQPVINDID